MPNYEKLDFLLIEAIRQPGTHKFTSLMSGAVKKEAAKLADDDIAARGVAKAAPDFRIVDRRLQALRKRGLIYYLAGQWHAESEQLPLREAA